MLGKLVNKKYYKKLNHVIILWPQINNSIFTYVKWGYKDRNLYRKFFLNPTNAIWYFNSLIDILDKDFLQKTIKNKYKETIHFKTIKDMKKYIKKEIKLKK